MKIGILQICAGECISDNNNCVDIQRVSYILSKHGYFVNTAICLSNENTINDAFCYLRGICDAVLVCGKTEMFYSLASSKYEIDRNLSTFLLDNIPCAVSENCNDEFVSDTLIPMLNSRCKTFYATNVFRTIGKTEQQLRFALKDFIKNRNKISVKFISNPPECAILVRYSNKTQKDTVQNFLSEITDILHDCTYSYSDIDISEKVADLLIKREKTLGLAESFTGGNIAASLVNFAGISSAFKEGIVCYDNNVKRKRLNVSQNVLDNHGAVSIETAYEMAANLLLDGQYDYVVATTGNAGPSSEKTGEVGVCYIAVGNKTNIDIYPCRFEGDRKTVINSGVKTALYHLYNRISEDFVKYEDVQTTD